MLGSGFDQISKRNEMAEAGEMGKKFIDGSRESYYCCYDNMGVPREVEDQVPYIRNGSEGKEREREHSAKYMA